MLWKVRYQVFTTRLFPVLFHDLSFDRVPNVNYTWTHPEWNIDILRTFIVFWQDTSHDLHDLYIYEKKLCETYSMRIKCISQRDIYLRANMFYTADVIF